jgi:hypothetical protein
VIYSVETKDPLDTKRQTRLFAPCCKYSLLDTLGSAVSMGNGYLAMTDDELACLAENGKVYSLYFSPSQEPAVNTPACSQMSQV